MTGAVVRERQNPQDVIPDLEEGIQEGRRPFLRVEI
jgi:hypothetical protein